MAKELVDEICIPYKKEKAMSKELMLRAYQSMELLVILTYKLGPGKVWST